MSRCRAWPTRRGSPACASWRRVAVEGFDFDDAGAVSRVRTDRASIACEQVVVAVGPWVETLWGQLGLPAALDVHTPAGRGPPGSADVDVLVPAGGGDRVRPCLVPTADGELPPVVHVDSRRAAARRRRRLITDELWGNYFKRDRHGVQGGASPIPKRARLHGRPYPTSSVDPGFADMWCASLSHCLERFSRLPLLATATCARAASVPSRSTTSPSSTTCGRTSYVDRRLEPRLQDDRRRPRGRVACCSASTRRCSTRSATSASRRATCTRSRTRRTPGPEDPAAAPPGAAAPIRSGRAILAAWWKPTQRGRLRRRPPA